MAKIHRSALVPYSAQQMFRLVNDIEAYPEYMEGCIGAEIIRRQADTVEARLDLSKGGIRHSITTVNHLHEPYRMQMKLAEGPFSHFEGVWQFESLAQQGCKLSLNLRFEFSSAVLQLAAGRWFEKIASRQVDALCRRAEVVYG